jgi:hypothetical protein
VISTQHHMKEAKEKTGQKKRKKEKPEEREGK